MFVICGPTASAESTPKPPAGTPPQSVTLLRTDHLPQPVPDKRVVIFSSDYDSVAVVEPAAGGSYQTRVLRSSDGALLQTFAHDIDGYPVFSPDGQYLVNTQRFRGRDLRVTHIWRLTDATLIGSHNIVGSGFVISPDSTTSAIIDGNEIKIMTFPDMTPTVSINDISIGQSMLALSSDGRFVASLYAKGVLSSDSRSRVGVWRVDTGELAFVTEAAPHFRVIGGSHVTAIAFSPDDALLATGHWKGIDLWRLPDGAKVGTVGEDMETGKNRGRRTPTLVAFNHSGTVLASVSYNFLKPAGGAAIRVWRVHDGQLLSSYEEQGHQKQLPWFASMHPRTGVFLHIIGDDGPAVWRLDEISAIFTDNVTRQHQRDTGQ